MDKKKDLVLDVSVEKCIVSPLNSRQTHPEGAVEKLSERIKRYGFETTRAVWAIKNKDDLYEVFAGGIRLDASKRAKVNVAVLEHKGFSEEEIVKLSDKDNEDDEYHTKVSPVDTWENYARLQEMGWTQEKIADIKSGSKRVTQSLVSKRLKLNKDVSYEAKQSIHQEKISEGHLIEIHELFINEYLSPWLSIEEIRKELVDKTIIDIQKNTGKTTSALRKDVKKIQEVVDEVDSVYNSFKEKEKICYLDADGEFVEEDCDLRKDFLETLSTNGVRSLSDVAYYGNQCREKIQDSIILKQDHLQGEANTHSQESERADKLSELREKFLNVNCLEEIKNLEDKSVKLVLTDPPYGVEYQSNRRNKAEKHKKISGDTDKEAMNLIDSMLEEVKCKLLDDAHVLIFIGSKNLCNLREILKKHNFTLKGELIWVKEEHGSGDIKGSFAPQHEYIIHAVQGKPLVSPRRSTVFNVAREGGARAKDHPTKKPVDLLEQLIDSTTEKGDLVIDGFAGVASTLVASYNTEREYWGCEIDKEYHKKGMESLEELVRNKYGE